MLRLNKGSNQYKNKWGLSPEAKESVYEVIIICLTILLIYSKISPLLEPKIISPLTDNPVIPHVQAKEPLEPTTKNIVNYIIEVFSGEGDQVTSEALKISYCESKWNPESYNYNLDGTGDYGIFQINQVHTADYGTGYYHDWRENIRVAHKIYKTSGWSPWVCRYILH